MAPLIHANIRVKPRQADPPADDIVHSLYFEYSSAIGAPEINWQSAADSIADTFFQSGTGGGGTVFQVYQFRHIQVTLYDMADTKPRPPKATSIKNPVSWEGAALAPREVACCMSYYAGRNLPRLRGRTYIGPFLLSTIGETVPTNIRSQLLSLGYSLKHDQGQWIDWVQYSPTTATATSVTDVWVNDIWDTMSSREPHEQARSTLHL